MIRRTLFVISEYNDQYYVCLILNDNRILLIKSLCDQQLISYNIASTMLMRCKVVRGIYQKTLNLCFMLVGNRQQWVFAISWNWFYLVDLNLRYAFFFTVWDITTELFGRWLTCVVELWHLCWLITLISNPPVNINPFKVAGTFSWWSPSSKKPGLSRVFSWLPLTT